MSMSPLITTQPVIDASRRIAEANHCQAGGAIAMSGALAAALAQATANTTRADGAQGDADAAAATLQHSLSRIRSRLLALADEDAEAITVFVELRNRGEALKGYGVLCDGPREMAGLAIEATRAMQQFRAQVGERGKDDLEFAITLMAGAARAATQLLDSNLRIWPLPDLLAQYDPHVQRLLAAIEALTPVQRIRKQ
jgi:hypothetical protein